MPLDEIRLNAGRRMGDEIYLQLKSAILAGKLAPSERLVEESIAELASVSRTPVREALRRLQADGLVEERGPGLAVTVVTAQRLAELCIVREALEGLAAYLAAESRTELDLLFLKQVLDDSNAAEAGASDEAQVRLNHAFHKGVWSAARNGVLSAELRGLRNEIERMQGTTLTAPGRLSSAIGEHRELLEAIRTRNPVAARDLAQLHFRTAMAIRLAKAGGHVLAAED